VIQPLAPRHQACLGLLSARLYSPEAYSTSTLPHPVALTGAQLFVDAHHVPSRPKPELLYYLVTKEGTDPGHYPCPLRGFSSATPPMVGIEHLRPQN
jgi:hypothetical protein